MRKKQMIARFFSIIGFTGLLLASANSSGADRQSYVEINGQILSSTELISLESRLGARIGPGNYLVDPQSGCWLNITTGWTGCIGDPGMYPSRNGSDKRNWNEN